jgi:pyrophosphatase PpaX
MNSNRIDTVLFDWDGTLLNSAPSAFLVFQRTFRELGIDLRPEEYQSLYSPNWYRMYEALGLPPGLWENADRLWLRFNDEYPAALMPGALETVRALSDRGYLLGVVTSGSRSRVVREIGEHGLTACFRVVVCNEDILKKKPDPEGLNKAITALDRTHRECCYVGDTPEDILMGESAQVLTFAVEGGYPRSSLPPLSAVRLDCIANLLAHLP